jgi:hypothetical protein
MGICIHNYLLDINLLLISDAKSNAFGRLQTKYYIDCSWILEKFCNIYLLLKVLFILGILVIYL